MICLTRGQDLDQELKRLFESHLERWIGDHYLSESPDSLGQACAYALRTPGKRVRPILLLETCRLFSPSIECALNAALAIELVHTYSLVHDDLPAMDDDEWRRGKATVHKLFGEATAILVGDALLTDAFSALAVGYRDQARLAIDLSGELAKASGSGGMVHGQALDMFWGGRSDHTGEALVLLHTKKTASLLATTLVMGALCAGALPQDLVRLRRIGLAVGLNFQLCDDLLDSASGTGKSPGKDRAQKKLSFLNFTDDLGIRTTIADELGLAYRELANFPNSDRLVASLKALEQRSS